MNDRKILQAGNKVDQNQKNRCILFDWGGTLMREFPEFEGPMAEWPKVEILPGVLEILAELQGSWLIALATNAEASGESDIRKALSRAGINEYIERIYCYREIGYRKPSREFFLRILSDLNLPPEVVCMVGDDFDRDVLGANRAGIRAVWLNDQTADAPEEITFRTIQSLHQLSSALNGLFPEGEKTGEAHRAKGER